MSKPRVGPGPKRVSGPVHRAVRAWFAAGHIPADGRVVVACSGGADSLALAAAVLADCDRRTAAEPVATVVDHALQRDSAEVAAAAAQTLQALGYRSVEVRRVDVGRVGGMEAAARTARYAALERSAAEHGAAAVLLGHTVDDQAETVLLGLGRGSGPRSIAGMRPWAMPWGRPLLYAVRRSDTEQTCRDLGVTPWADPHNANLAFTRVRLRREVIPLLDDALGGGVVPALARTAELMADDLDGLDDLAARALRESLSANGDIDIEPLRTWPRAVRRRVLRAWVDDRIGTTALTYRHLVALENLVIRGRSRQSVRLPGGIDAVRRGRSLAISTAPQQVPPAASGPDGKWQAV